MRFELYKDEAKEVVDLVNKCFNLDYDYKNFGLLDNQKVLLLKNIDEIVGCTLITLKKDPFKNIKVYYLDYFCIKEEYQHLGLGEKLFDEVERMAKEEQIDHLELTSNKKRENARKLYFNKQMEIIDTDLFIKKLN